MKPQVEDIKITEEALEKLRRLIGVTIREPEPHITEITRDSVKHFCYGIGDDNPLWLDAEYSKRRGGPFAPPTILYSTSKIVSGYVSGLPGVHAMYAGTDWKFYKPIKWGYKIHTKSFLKNLVEVKTQFADKSVKQIYTTHFYNQFGEIIAEADSWCFRTERVTAAKKGKYKEKKIKKWDEEELKKVRKMYNEYQRTGSRKLYWEDVEIGDTFGPLPKGPLTVTSIISFIIGWGGLYIKSHKLLFELFKHHPSLAIPNDMGLPEPPERVHWDSSLARAVGVPAAYDYGPERVTWLGQLMTDWIGDHGFLKQLYVEVRSHNVLGDLTLCYGKVIDKYLGNNKGTIKCELYAKNQEGEITAKGYAIAELPVKLGN